MELLNNIISRTSILHLNILLLLGLALFGGTIGGRFFQRLKIPQVVGYIVIGIILGQACLNIIDKKITETLQPLSYLALGLIGFMIGGELKKDLFRKYGRQFFTILFCEGMAAFLAVFLLIGFFGSMFFGGGSFYWAFGLLLGAIASATAPEATTDVLWEYKTRGPLTSTVLGIVAMDDALALLLFAIAASVAGRFLGRNGMGGLLSTIAHPLYEIFGAIFIGSVSALILTKIVKKYNDREKLLAFSVGTVLFVLGLSIAINVSMLLAAMTLGMVVVNREPRISKEVFKMVGSFAGPIYVLFFVLVGAKLNFHDINYKIILISGIYLIGRTAGKMAGANLGARIAGSPDSIRKYLPFCLFSQAGVAIGLSIVVYNIFPSEIGNSIVITIIASTFVVQLIGPPFVKYAVTKAGEVGLNVTEEDVTTRTNVGDIMDKKAPLVQEETPLAGILDIYTKSPYLNHLVINKYGKLTGGITMDSIRHTFMQTDLGNLLLAHDIMEPIAVTIKPDSSLLEARELFDKYDIDYLPVLNNKSEIEGFIEKGMLNKFVSEKMIEIERKAFSLG
ncbi:MAG: cation:proton antiporter [Candidatus Omnitrophica bacterium]|nr:cation:proton antiporter [Candidatus Omnitrophota bacterium]